MQGKTIAKKRTFVTNRLKVSLVNLSKKNVDFWTKYVRSFGIDFYQLRSNFIFESIVHLINFKCNFDHI